MSDQAEVRRDQWTAADVSRYLEIQPTNVKRYLALGLLPAPDSRYGRTNLWRPETIIGWHTNRPRNGGRAESGSN